MDLTKIEVIDIETNDLLSGMVDYRTQPYKLKADAKLWCVVVRNVGTGRVQTARQEECTKEWLQNALKDCEILVAHNGISFDLPALWLFGILDYSVGNPGQSDTIFGREIKIVDSLILSRLLNPDRYGGHSLAAWGERSGNEKTDFRQACIDAGIIDAKSPPSAEFKIYSEIMVDYCVQDTSSNVSTFFMLLKEMKKHNGWKDAFKMESKLEDLSVAREHLGFYFDKELAIECVADLQEKIETITNSINPILPPRKMNVGELKEHTPPTTQLVAAGTPGKHMINFAERVGAEIVKESGSHYLTFEGQKFKLPMEGPVKSKLEATIKDRDHIKMYLIHLGWIPTEWRQRDLTKDSKKQSLPYEKRVAALERWFKETMEGKYRKQRVLELGIKPEYILPQLYEKLKEDWPVRVPTSPSLRVGVEKELCPNLVKIEKQVPFARDYALYLTYRHRLASIAGGDIEDMDFDEEYPNTGYLSLYREEDGRVPTPAILIGAATSRYRHVKIANIPRITSLYGDKMRALFGCAPGRVQLGFDFSSLENRVYAGFVKKYPGGPELGESLSAEKPNDSHSVLALKIGISRTDAKSVNYASIYGASGPKLGLMLGKTREEGIKINKDFWESVPALRMLRDALIKEWEDSGKKYIKSIDGRLVRIRSAHSILNFLFQSTGVVCAKYTTVYLMQILEEQGLCISPFKGIPDACPMIEYHDEVALECSPKLFKFKKFKTEEAAKEFVKNWEGDQLSAISEGKTWYVALPNPVSIAIKKATERVERELGLEFQLGFEYILGKNWAECH